VLHGVRRELASIQDEVRSSGWTSDLAGRALAALRIVAAYTAGKPVTQHSLRGGRRVSPISSIDGQVVISPRIGSPAIVSSTVATTDDDELRDALARFAAARYGRDAAFDARLDETLDSAVRRAERLAAGRPWKERLWAR
ncbi:MAG: hypothetical protein ACRD26_12405, partial [Vicinamibacterales bacterium]